jgi:hypothetical protein
MADYTTHVAFSKLVSKKIKIKDENRFLVSSLIPDLCRREDEDKIISHFASRVDGLKDPNLDLFLHKYKDKIKDEAVLGIYSHLYLDKHFFGKFFHDNFIFKDGNAISKRTNKSYNLYHDFFRSTGIYKEYSAMAKEMMKKYNIDFNSFDFNLDNLPNIEELDMSLLNKSKEKVLTLTSEKGEYTKDFIIYEEVIEFIEKLSNDFINNLKENDLI